LGLGFNAGSDALKYAGYCALCRREEIELYDECVGFDEEKHILACLTAGCLHPPYEILI
jgi:hypothetical protein